MLANSRGIALILALSISIMVAAFLSLVDNVSATILLVAGGLSFSISYILITITLEFLVFRELGNIYKLLEKIQKKDLNTVNEVSTKASISPLRGVNKVINAYAIAQQKEIEALQKNAEFRKDFIADISHELKTPIFATQGYIHTLLDGAIDDNQVRMKFLKRAAKSLDTLDNIVHDLLTLNQMESGHIKFKFVDFDLRGLALEAIDQLEHKASKKNIKLSLEHDPKKNYYSTGDPDKIYRVFQNLIFNALNYNDKEGEVIVSLKKQKDHIQVDIKDDGKGIPEEDLKRIFERFYRVEKSRNKKAGGTGLGLAIVKHILEGHKSKISVTSTLGKGSTFSFSLPLLNEKDIADEVSVSSGKET